MFLIKYDYLYLIYKYKQFNTKMKNDKVIIIRISDDIKSKYEKLLDENGMNLSKRLKLLINEDIKKLNTEL